MEKQTSVGHLKSFFQSRSNICFIIFRFQYFDQVSDTWQCFLACLDTCIFFLDFYILTKCQALGHFFCPVGFFIVSSFYTKFNVLSLKYTCLFGYIFNFLLQVSNTGNGFPFPFRPLSCLFWLVIYLYKCWTLSIFCFFRGFFLSVNLLHKIR